MLFPTLEFAIFFAVVFCVSWSLRRRDGLRKLFLLAASYYFYSWWDWRFSFLLLFASLVAYAGGLAVALLLVVLGFFKYFDFFLSSLATVLADLGLARDIPLLQIVLPVGISFFAFHALSYIVDVYRGHAAPRRSLVDLLL